MKQYNMTLKVKYKNEYIEFIIDSEDYDLFQSKLFYANKRPNNIFYLHCRKTNEYFHRIVAKAQKGEIVDHINGNTLDNRKCNLRIVSIFENSMNAPKFRTKKFSSKYRGVTFHKEQNKWMVRISVKGKRIQIGYFNTELEAVTAYNLAAQKYHGEFARLNIVKNED